MSRDRKDRSGNWIIDNHGDSFLRLAKVTGFTSWRPASTVLTFPKQMPDGLLDVTFRDRPEPDPFLIEIESYPEPNTLAQLRDDAAMVLLTRGLLPNILLVVLYPKGNLRIDPEHAISSSHGLCELRLRVTVVNMWTISAEELLAANDVGLIPLVPLTQYTGPPEAMLQLCAERIAQQASPKEEGNLLAATRVMAERRYNKVDLLRLLGGVQDMSWKQIFESSPSVMEAKAEAERKRACKYILHLLEKRFGPAPEDLAAHLRTIEDQDKLDRLLDVAVECADLEAFRVAMNRAE